MSSTTTIFGRLPSNDIKPNIITAKEEDPLLGVRYPLYDKTSSAKGIFNKTASFELLKSELRQFVRTERGERVMLPNFGLPLKKYLFEPMTPDVIQNIEETIMFGVTNYVPQARILKLNIQSGDDVTGLGLPGIKITMLVGHRQTTEQGILELKL